MIYTKYLLAIYILCCCFNLSAQDQYELNTGWQCINISKIKDNGEAISQPGYHTKGWLPATVPGTVLTTLLNNKLMPDPFYGMNNNKIPDIYTVGRDYYTYWFIKDFTEKSTEQEQVYLRFRGVNYSYDVFLNGHRLNKETNHGMLLRHTYNITPYLNKDGNNRLAVIVYPPDPVGKPNGGQGGDGTIAKNLTSQYVAGWDWIQPIRDRNTGIWDKVTIEKTKGVDIKNPHIITLVPGVRVPGAKPANEQAAIIKISAEVENPSNDIIHATVQYELAGSTIKKDVTLQPHTTSDVQMPDYTLNNPKLWWPNGYGEQPLYTIQLRVVNATNTELDKENVSFGVREIQTHFNDHTMSMQVFVNGQKIFIKGGDWIISDAMLRFSPERYDAEVRFHRDMNLNLIRIWGGAIIERPEFYDACDKYGILVFQDLGFSGDCNGRWVDPMKKEDQWTRRKYPDDHVLFIATAIDQVKLIRNHPSLAFWCGGNEITPPTDLFHALKDSIIPKYDGTRLFFDYSNSDSMSYCINGGSDGPYGIQDIKTFWGHKTFPFNSEVGSVGIGDYESLQRFIPKEDLIVPFYPYKGERPELDYMTNYGKIDSVWKYHKYLGYNQYINYYGTPGDIKDFANKAQLVNYDQYRALIEGFTAHMWDWYTGVIIWKTQNPWTALRGQMYDCYLDVNACLYGLRNAGEQVHVMYNAFDSTMMIANSTCNKLVNVAIQADIYDMQGKDSLIDRELIEINPYSVKKFDNIGDLIRSLGNKHGLFLSMRLLDDNQKVLSNNLYWLTDSTGHYSGLQTMAKANVQVAAKRIDKDRVEVTITNPANGPLAFFNRVSLVDAQTKMRVLPIFYSDNYFTVLPGEHKTIIMEYVPTTDARSTMVSLSGWNVNEQYIEIH